MSAATDAIGPLIAAARNPTGPVVVGIAGGVAVGKTTVAGELRRSLAEPVTVVGTDGFLFPNAVLAARGLTERKGFPETFDVSRLRSFLTSVRAGRLPLTVPRYSHTTYDIDGEEVVAAAPVVVVEGVNVLAAAADLLDVAVYLDADESELETWFLARFRALVAAAADDPTSFYRPYVGSSAAEISSLAAWVWREVNLVNLREHIAPSRAHAACIITKGPDHAILAVTTRDESTRAKGPDMATDRELVAQLEHVWHSVHRVGIELTDAEWKTPTEVPGWTVQDNLVHLSALESRLLGRPEPDHEIPDGLAHVKNDFGRSNEVFVDSRRGWSGADALAEFDEVTSARLAVLHGYAPDDFGADSWTPVGPGSIRDLLPFRVFDSWVHEQDMRRAVKRPGDLDGSAAEAARDRILASMPFVIGKRVAPAEGSTVAFELSAPLPVRAAVRMEGRARRLDEMPPTATVTIRTDGETFTRLACGRCDPAAVLASGAVSFDGDAALGRRVVESLNFLF